MAAATKKKAEEKAEAPNKAAQQRRESATPPMVRAKARYVRVAPRKARLVADQIRGLPVDEARTLLTFSSRGAARDLLRLLDSAAANAEANHELIADDLRIAEMTRGRGPYPQTLARAGPRPRHPDPQAHQPPVAGADPDPGRLRKTT